jgi:hypothetical protein
VSDPGGPGQPPSGGWSPPPGGYQPPPGGYQPPSGGGYQPPGGSYPPPSSGQGPEINSAGGFFNALFDFSFQRLVTTRLIKILYILAFVIVTLYALGILAALAQAGGGGLVFGLIVAPIFWLIGICYVRVFLEVLIVLFRINDNTAAMASRR